MRLDKFLAEASVGTRRISRSDVRDGLVTVNNQVILEPATEINEVTDVIRHQENIITHTGKVYYMFHKPGGCITATKDAFSKTVLDYFDRSKAEGLFPVGRLDKDTEGLLLLTNDGEFNHNLMHPAMHVEKTYYFWALGSLNTEARELLRNGIKIGEAEALAKALQIEVEAEGEYEEIKAQLKHETWKAVRINPFHQPVVYGAITISEGRKHQVKRMLKAVGCYVIYLKRISIGRLRLDEALQKGQYRELTKQELDLFQFVGGKEGIGNNG